MPSTFSPNLNLELQATGEDAGVWGQNLNNNVFTVLDNVLGAVLSLPLTNVNVTLTTEQTQNNFIDLSGILTANVNIIFPAIGRTFYVRNRTTGLFSVTLSTASPGLSVVIPQGITAFIILNGADVLMLPSGAWSLISERTFSGTNAVNFTNLSSFRKLRLTGNIANSTSSGIYIRTSTNNGATFDSGATDYSIQNTLASGSSVTASLISSSAFNISSILGIDLSTQSTFEVIINIFNTTGGAQFISHFSGVRSASFFSAYNVGQRNSSTPRNAFQIFAGTGMMNGNVTLEGVPG